jgi:hypothetical protein
MRKTLYQERTEAFQRGYRQALRDVLLALDEDGTDGARRWILDNLGSGVAR